MESIMNFQMTAEKIAGYRARASHLTTGDRYGRPYAKLSELKPGSMVQVDEGFPFGSQSEIRPWSLVEVKSNDEGLYLDSIYQDGELHLNCEIHLTHQACCEYWPDEGAVDGGDNDAVIGVYHAGIPLSLNEQFAHDNGASLFLPPYPRGVNRSKAEIERMVALVDPRAALDVAESGEITIRFSDGSDREIHEGPDSEGLYRLFYSNVR
jgi:hypothetical protein